MVHHIIILAGGSGTRLWPASNRTHPKQFLDAGDGKSFLQKTVLRALSLPFRGKILIVTHRDHCDEVIRHLSDLPSGRERIRVLPEPESRNTAPAVALGVAWLRSQGGREADVLVMPADHVISPVSRFKDDVDRAAPVAAERFLVTFGIPPARPETGYGYIEAGAAHGRGRIVVSFKEKPDLERAKAFLEAGNFFWNSGMFLFTLETFWRELTALAPAIAQRFAEFSPEPVERVQQGVNVVWEGRETERLYAGMPSISLDYAVMEKSGSVAMVDTTFSWNDIGSWDEYAALLGSGDQNDLFSVETRDNFVRADIPVALCGVEDLIVVMKNGRLLICKKGTTQKVKSLVDQMKDRGRTELT